MGYCKNPTTNKKGTKQMSFVLILTFFTYIHGFTEVHVCIELLISQSSGQNLGFEFIDIQIENKAKPNHNSRKFAISTCLYPENKKLKQHNAKILCFNNESEGSKTFRINGLDMSGYRTHTKNKWVPQNDPCC